MAPPKSEIRCVDTGKIDVQIGIRAIVSPMRLILDAYQYDCTLFFVG